MSLACVLLAAGSSRRFGQDDKLLSLLDGGPLVSYAANALRGLRPEALIGVARSPGVIEQLSGFDIVTPPEVDPEQADSLRAGVRRARELGATRVLVALGDMPFITTGHLATVAERCTDTQASAVSGGARPMPPACFPASLIPDLLALHGDHGAGSLLRALPSSALVDVPADLLRDVDTPANLSALGAGQSGVV